MLTRENLCIDAITTLNDVHHLDLAYIQLLHCDNGNCILCLADKQSTDIQIAIAAAEFDDPKRATENQQMSLEEVLLLRIAKAIFDNYKLLRKPEKLYTARWLDNSSITVRSSIDADDVSLFNGSSNLTDTIVELNNKLADKTQRIQELEDKLSQIQVIVDMLSRDYSDRINKPDNYFDND